MITYGQYHPDFVKYLCIKMSGSILLGFFSDYLNLGIVDIWGQSYFVEGSVLRIGGSFSASLVPTHSVSAAFPLKKCLRCC